MIDNLKDLEKLFKLCRKQGVMKLEIDMIKFEMGDLPQESVKLSEATNELYQGFPEGELTPEQLMYYSAGGTPENDPELKKEAS